MDMAKRFLLLPNEKKDPGLAFTKTIVDFLTVSGQRVCMMAETAAASDAAVEIFQNDGADAAIVLGGDGTILRWAHRLLEQNIPLFGINFGHLGYLTEAEPASAKEALQKIVDGDYLVENRMMIKAVLETEGDTPKEFFACNDIVLHRGGLCGMLPVRAYINDTFMETFLCDGIIVATPSGSTAYNYSAGGPIVDPLAENMIFTPICSHSTTGRSIVTSSKDRFRFEIDGGRSSAPVLNVDGVENVPLTCSGRITVEKSPTSFRLIRVTNQSFFEILHSKLYK